MSAPLILPKGNDRTWTRAFYKAINRIARYQWWKTNGDAVMAAAEVGILMYGRSTIQVSWDSAYDSADLRIMN